MQHLEGYNFTVSSLLDFLDRFLEFGPFSDEHYTILDYQSLYPSIKLAPAALMLYHFNLYNTYLSPTVLLLLLGTFAT